MSHCDGVPPWGPRRHRRQTTASTTVETTTAATRTQKSPESAMFWPEEDHVRPHDNQMDRDDGLWHISQKYCVRSSIVYQVLEHVLFFFLTRGECEDRRHSYYHQVLPSHSQPLVHNVFCQLKCFFLHSTTLLPKNFHFSYCCTFFRLFLCTCPYDGVLYL